MQPPVATRIIEKLGRYSSSAPTKDSDHTENEIDESSPGSANVAADSVNENRLQQTVPNGVARVSYSKRIRRITLQRFIVSKIVHHPERVTYAEVLVLYDNILALQDLAIKDPGFREKFGEALEALAAILKNLRFSVTRFPSGVRKLSAEFAAQLQGFILPERNLQGTERHLKGHFHVLAYKESGIPNREIPPKPYIGVGYNDKGHYQDVAVDGSPHWTEVIKGGVE